MLRTLVITGLTAATGLLCGVLAETMLARPASVVAVSSDPAVNAILGRACQDCHSAQTAWPWYARLPKIGPAIHRDVAAGRAQLDLSRWSEYAPAQRDEVLAEIGALVRNRLMPPSRYTLLHPHARLSADDVRRLTDWTSAERRRMRASNAARQMETE